MTIRFKKLHPDAQLPKYATPGAAGADISACLEEPLTLYPGECQLVPTGWAMEVPEGYGAYIIPRSGLGAKKGIVIGNLVGLIDSDYRGQVYVAVWNRNDADTAPYTIQPGERIAQLCLIKTRQYALMWADELNDTRRGTGGFGSTDG